jgi:hypothetical protein
VSFGDLRITRCLVAQLAHRLDDSVGSLQTLEYAADLAGLSTEALTNSVSKLNQMPAEAARTGAGL